MSERSQPKSYGMTQVVKLWSELNSQSMSNDLINNVKYYLCNWENKTIIKQNCAEHSNKELRLVLLNSVALNLRIGKVENNNTTTKHNCAKLTSNKELRLVLLNSATFNLRTKNDVYVCNWIKTHVTATYCCTNFFCMFFFLVTSNSSFANLLPVFMSVNRTR